MKFFLLRHAWRSISRMRTYTIINLVGLVISLTGAIVIARYVYQELTVDDYIKDVDRVMVLCNYDRKSTLRGTDAKNWNNVDNWDDPFADPAVECYTRFVPLSNPVKVVVDSVYHFSTVIMVDSMFLKILPRVTVEGVQEMKNVTDVIVSRAMAEKMWHGESAVGKKIEYESYVLNVVGVVDVPPTKCNYDFDMLVRHDLHRSSTMGHSIVKLYPSADCRKFNERHKPFMENNGTSNSWHFQLVPLKKVYFMPSFGRYGNVEYVKLGNMRGLKLLIGSGLLLLAIGLLNFINISATVMVGRRKEFTIKKAMGAGNLKLFAQIYFENLFVALVAVLACWILVSIVSPMLVRIYGMEQICSLSFDVALSVGIAVILPLLTSVPMLCNLVRTNIVDVMGRSVSSKFTSHIRLVSLEVQYLITFFLLVVSGFSMCQLYYMLNADMGYRTTDIICANLVPSNGYRYVSDPSGIHVETDDKAQDLTKFMMNKLKESPLFEAYELVDDDWRACITTKLSIDDCGGVQAKVADSEQDFQTVDYLLFTKKQLDIYGIQLVEGRLMSEEECRSSNYKVLIDKRTKELLGIKDIHKDMIQLDHRIWYSANQDCSGNPPFEIIGVVDEFKTHHLSSRDAPKIITMGCSVEETINSSKFLFRVKTGKRDEAIAYLKKLYAEYVDRNNELEYSLVEDEIEDIYEEDSRVAHLYTTFAMLSILVSCMGLFGISLYDIQHRRREIAIRKVNGAKMKDIFILMSRRYVYTLAVAIAIGTPIALYALHIYIEGYAHHVPLTPLYFFLSAFLMLTLTLLTIFIQVRRAVKENPADVMKSE